MFDNQSTFQLLFSIFVSVVGMGYCAHGRKNNPYYLMAGIGLLFIPMFIDNFGLLLGISCLLIVLPFLLDR